MAFSRRRLFGTLGALSVAGLGGLAARAAIGRYYEGPISDHFDGVRFADPGEAAPKRLADLARWLAEGGRAEWPAFAPSPYADRPPPRVEGSRLRLSFVGHASLLIQTGGRNILTDPVW